METKVCNLCKKTKPLEEFSRDRTSPGGFDYRCKQCNRERFHKRKGEDGLDAHNKRKAQQQAMRAAKKKKCPRCGKVKDHSHFLPKGPSKSKAPRLSAWCRACINAYAKEKAPIYLAKPGRRERKNASHRARYRRKMAEDPEAIRKIYREKYTKTPQARARLAMHAHKRRARLRGLPSDWTAKDLRALIVLWENRCAYCNEYHEVIQPDHVHPISRGGPNLLENLVPACEVCNKSKNATPLEKWLEHEPKKLKAFLKRWETRKYKRGVAMQTALPL